MTLPRHSTDSRGINSHMNSKKRVLRKSELKKTKGGLSLAEQQALTQAMISNLMKKMQQAQQDIAGNL